MPGRMSIKLSLIKLHFHSATYNNAAVEGVVLFFLSPKRGPVSRLPSDPEFVHAVTGFC
jgi:hypothetical protein